jgi:GMP synthase (glutamine-hydrolysing)
MDRIIILDFGGQYTQLIARKVREARVFSEILPYSTKAETIKKHKPKGIILSGGPASVYQQGAPLTDNKILGLGIPILGICYGLQIIVHLLGGKLSSKGMGEYGETEIYLKENNLFNGIGRRAIRVWMSHRDNLDPRILPKGFSVIANSKQSIAAIAYPQKKMYGLQFHPEVSHTQGGTEIIKNFVQNICRCKQEWTPHNFINVCKDYIKEKAGKNNILCFVSGGVDSSFVAALLSQTKGIDKVYPVYIEALMRKNETQEIRNSLEKAGIKNLIVYKAEEEFINALKDISEPEEKRKIIGNLFGDIQERIVKKLQLIPDETMLAQGTLYTDLIESGEGVGLNASRIKSHHNVGCEFIKILKKKGRILEPNRWVFKDEVRKAAKEIGLPKEIYDREPFPGPGLAIRIIDGKKRWEAECNRISKKVNQISNKYGLKGFAAPVKTVGVQGDHRTYKFLAVISGPKEWKKIREAAIEIPISIPEVNRVAYAFEPISAFPKAIQTMIDKETITLLKEVDYKGRKILHKEELSQTIFVLFGADLSGSGKRSIALRAVITNDFMTVKPAQAGKDISWEKLNRLNKMVKEHAGSFVIDVTDKPPATICWE